VVVCQIDSFQLKGYDMNWFQGISLKSIDLYQGYLSPLKGYSCAYRVLHGDLSCSSYCKQQIANHGVLTGIKNTLNRFKQGSRLEQRVFKDDFEY
jgi:putative component of membrane protein insertase Oxa1/YidC/SpoIIIJ protein YidD